MTSKRASIRDVAVAAGVSQTTVSHALNDARSDRVAEDTRARVKEIADRLGYTPSRMARGLRLQRTHTLGMISDTIATTPYAGNLILGAQETALKRGWTLLLMNTGGDEEVERRAVKELVQHQVDGVLYARMYHQIVALPKGMRGIPTVLMDAECSDPKVPSVVPDEIGGGRVAVEALIARGHIRIGFVNNVDDIPATHGRLTGYHAALEAAGIRADPTLVVNEHAESAGGYRATLRLLRRRHRPTGLFCFNDRMAMGAYRAAAELGLNIPTDLSIVGFDNQELIAEGLYPSLTTVALPHYEMGRWAAETLLEAVESPSQRTRAEYPYAMSCPLVERGSVGRPATS